ncbi:MAG: hypothetical protein SGPRY_010616 [Prymnesium sp.]
MPYRSSASHAEAIPSSFEAMALEKDFATAVEQVARRPLGGLDESKQRRLYGLYHRVTSGPAAFGPTQGLAREQRLAWEEASSLCLDDAMIEYVTMVESLLGPEDVFLSDDEEAPVDEELKRQVVDHLPKNTAGGKQSESSWDIFAAARSGGSIAAFLPDQCEAKDQDGLSALHHAVDSENLVAVGELVKSGACLDVRDAELSTPIHFAALLGSHEIARLLVDANADITLLDGEEKSAIAIASEAGHAELAQFLAQQPMQSSK